MPDGSTLLPKTPHIRGANIFLQVGEGQNQRGEHLLSWQVNEDLENAYILL